MSVIDCERDWGYTKQIRKMGEWDTWGGAGVRFTHKDL